MKFYPYTQPDAVPCFAFVACRDVRSKLCHIPVVHLANGITLYRSSYVDQMKSPVHRFES